MARPSRSLDRKLLAAAAELLPKSGISGLSIREVCREAGVNLGMFYYHFKTKEAFVRRLLQETYEDFFVTFKEAADGDGDPRRRLRKVLVAFARFARDRRDFYALLARELLNDQPQCLSFIRTNFPRHASVLFELIQECSRDKLVKPMPIPLLAAFAMTSMGVPNLLIASLEKQRPRSIRGLPFGRFRDVMISDEAIEMRADLVMAAVSR